MKTKIFILLFALVASVGTTTAALVDGLYYSLNRENKTAEVCYKSYSSSDSYNYNWHITSANIPAYIEYEDETYQVIGIEDNAFRFCSDLATVTIAEGVRSIGKYAFFCCRSLISIEIPNSVTTIGNEAFGRCDSMTVAKIGDGVVNIGSSAFSGCHKLTTVIIGNGVKNIGESAFYSCSVLTSLTLGNSVDSIGNSAFDYCYKLHAVNIPKSVSYIGNYAFARCQSMVSLELPDANITFGKSAFFGCKGLKAIYNHAAIPQVLESDIFGGNREYYGVYKSSCILYVPAESIDLYKEANVWKDFSNIESLDKLEDLNNISLPNATSAKLLHNGQIYILRGEKVYTITGQEVR